MSNIAKVAGIAANTLTTPLNVEEVFSTYLYTGNGSTQTITNGVDLSGEGGLVWIKSRSNIDNNQLFDTTRGATKELISNSTAAEATRQPEQPAQQLMLQRLLHLVTQDRSRK